MAAATAGYLPQPYTTRRHRAAPLGAAVSRDANANSIAFWREQMSTPFRPSSRRRSPGARLSQGERPPRHLSIRIKAYFRAAYRMNAPNPAPHLFSLVIATRPPDIGQKSPCFGSRIRFKLLIQGVFLAQRGRPREFLVCYRARARAAGLGWVRRLKTYSRWSPLRMERPLGLRDKVAISCHHHGK